MSRNFAHRGFSGRYPENTLLAFEKAIEAGADGIELDVHLTKDGELIIHHDEAVDRTTDGHGYIWDLTLAELKTLDASATYKGVYGINRIPTLREYFDLIKDTRIVTNVELKTGINPYPGIEEKVLKLIDEYGLRDRIIISSFNHYSVMRMKALAPEMTCGFLEESWIIDAAGYAAAQGVEALHPIFCAVNEDYMKAAREKGLKVNVWTVNEEAYMREMARLGVDCIIGNFPDKCKKVLESL